MTAQTNPSPLGSDPSVAEAVAALRAGRAQEAIDKLQPIAGTPDPRFDVLYTLGMAYAQAGQMDQAAGTLQRAVANQPRHAPALFNLAQVTARLGRMDEARALLERVLAADPTYEKARQALQRLGAAAAPAAPAATGPPAAPAGPSAPGTPPGPAPLGAAPTPFGPAADTTPLGPAPLGAAPTPFGPAASSAGPAPSGTPPAGTRTGSVACPHCGAANKPGYFACSLCGKPGEQTQEAAAPAPAIGLAPSLPASPYAITQSDPEPEEEERTPEQEKHDLLVAGGLAGAVFLVFGALNAWKMYANIASTVAEATKGGGEEAGAAAAGLAFGMVAGLVFIKALVPFIAAMAVFTVMANLGTMMQRVTAAAVIAAVRVAIDGFFSLVIPPSVYLVLSMVTLGLGPWLVSVIVIYISTLTCIEKILDTNLEYSHNVAMAVVVATVTAWWIARLASVVLLGAMAGLAFR